MYGGGAALCRGTAAGVRGAWPAAAPAPAPTRAVPQAHLHKGFARGGQAGASYGSAASDSMVSGVATDRHAAALPASERPMRSAARRALALSAAVAEDDLQDEAGPPGGGDGMGEEDDEDEGGAGGRGHGADRHRAAGRKVHHPW